MSWQDIVKSIQMMRQLENALNNGIYDESDYTSKNAEKFQRFLRRKYNDKDIVVEYSENDKAFYIDARGYTYKFDIDGKFTRVGSTL